MYHNRWLDPVTHFVELKFHFLEAFKYHLGRKLSLSFYGIADLVAGIANISYHSPTQVLSHLILKLAEDFGGSCEATFNEFILMKLCFVFVRLKLDWNHDPVVAYKD